MLLIVSSKDSPFFTELTEDEKLIMSADSLFWANSNESLVLVLFSKNTLAIVRCLREGTFLIGRFNTSLNLSAVSKISLISSTDKFLINLLIIVYPFIY